MTKEGLSQELKVFNNEKQEKKLVWENLYRDIDECKFNLNNLNQMEHSVKAL